MKDQDTLILEQLYMEMSESKKVISLADIYGDIDEIPENEALYYEVDEDIFWVKIPVKVMSPDELKKLTTYQGDMTVLEAYQDFADKEQKKHS